MSHALALQFDSAFGLGHVVPVLRDFGIPIKTVRLDKGESLPIDQDEVRSLILLGGATRITSGAPDWLDDVVNFIRPRVEVDAMTLGFGLGGQLLAKAAGAEVKPLSSDNGADTTHVEFGRLTLPFPGGTDPILFGYATGTPQLFYQQDEFELPKLPLPEGYDADKPGPPPPTGNALLASSPWSKNAGFRFKNRLYGFAFNPEADRAMVEAIAKTHGGAAGSLKSSADEHLDRAERMGRRLLGNAVQFMHAYNPPMPIYS